MMQATQAPSTQLPLDPLAGLDSDEMDAPTQRPHHKAAPLPETGIYVEKCPKCRGTGVWRSFSGFSSGPCFHCKGTGKLTFKTSPDQRAKAQQDREAKKMHKEKVMAEKGRAWLDAHADERDWLLSRATSFDFAAKMLDGLSHYGSLTQGQHDAVRRLMAQDAQRAQERAAQIADAPAIAPDVTLPAVEQAFNKARDAGIKHPKLRLDGFTLSPAPATGKNPGAIYVKAGEDGTYLGKVMGGKFLRAHACDEATQEKVMATMADPLASAVAYGKRYGRCAICARELSNAESIERGIGPICAAKYGW